MSQQVNLFNPVFNQKKKHLSALRMVQAQGLLLLACLAWAAYLDYRLSHMEQLALSGQEQVAAQENALGQANRQSTPRQKSQQLAQEVTEAEIHLQALQQASTLLAGDKFGERRGYSDYFRGFARQLVSGLWLTGLRITGSTHDIGIEGQTLQAQLVPQYIERLATEPVFQGKSFSSLEMAPAVLAPGVPGKLATVPAAPANRALLAFKLEASAAEAVIVKAVK